MKTSLLTAPTTRSLRLGDVKRHLRLTTEYTDEDKYLVPLISVVESEAQNITNRKFVDQRWYMYLDEWPARDSIRTPFAPLTSAPSTAIVYKKSDGTSTTFSSSAWEVDTVDDYGRIALGYDESWPSETLWPVNPIRIEFKVGYGPTSTDIPDDIKQGMLLMLGNRYENREDVVVGYAGQAAMKLPKAAMSLLTNHKNFRL